MSKVRSKNTLLELDFKKLIRGMGFSYQPKIFGKPDFASRKLKVAIFLDSCFWHKCPQHFRLPSSNKEYWVAKINGNVWRAEEVNRLFRKKGWTVLRFWEHEFIKNPNRCIEKIILLS